MPTRSLLLVILALLLAVPIFAQVDTATIEALALDQSKAPLPGVTVTVTRPETGLSVVGVTDSSGTARFLSLAPGNYAVEFTLEGFATIKEKLTLVLGQNAKVPATIQAKTSDVITVNAAAEVVDLHKTDTSTNILPEQIEELPVPNRDFQRLAFLAPGVQRERGGFRFINEGPVIGSSGNASQTTILVDGVDVTDPALGLARSRFSQDAIREFRVIQDRFDSEIGGSAGGAMTIITKSGTNDVDGNVFGFFRDNNLRSKSVAEQQKSDYSRHQVGGTIGGPLLKDRMFYFASAEQIHEAKPTLFRPLGKFASTAADINHPFDQTLLFGSLDQQLSSKQTAGEKLVYETYKEDNFRVGGLAAESYGQTLKRRNWSATFQHNAVLSADMNNEARAQYGYHRYDEPTNSTSVAEWFSSGNTLMQGGNILGNLLGAGDTFEVRDTFYKHFASGRSSHDLKAGFSAQRVKERSRIDTYQYGLFLYLTDDRTLPLAYAYGVGSSDVTMSTNIYGAFIEDAWRPNTNLLVNLGLRYDLDTNGNNPTLQTPLNDGRKRDSNNYQPRVSFTYDAGGDGRNIVRGGAGRFVGRFLLVPALQERQQNGLTGRVTFTRINGALLGFPSLALDPNNPTTTGIVSKPAIIVLDPNYKNPEADQASLGYTMRLGQSRLFFDTEGIYVKGRDEIAIRDVNFVGNPIAATTAAIRPNTAFDQINMYTNGGHSTYRALVFSLNGNVRKNDLITASVTVANKKNISDDFSPEFPFGYPNDPANIEQEYGRARGTERYRIVLSGVFHAPWDVTVSPIYEYGSGQPWTHRLGYDLNGDGKNSDRCAASVPGTGFFNNVCPSGATYDRNGEKGPLFRNFSLRVTKAIPAGGLGRLEVIGEVFNAFNNVNWDVNSVAAGQFLNGPTLANYRTAADKTKPAAALANPAFGTYSATLQPREFQLGLRLVF
ncbi:MAG TPA: TonB-dependent receptor [Thermoanaerobaculia bacterium]|nr:TonB-dependent receptor [Thermoanaerobaculia bacterium]